MTRMLDLHSVETCSDQRLEPLAPAAVARMCPDSKRTSFVGNADCVLNVQACLWHESTAVRAQVSHERITEIVHDPARNQRPRDVRPANCPAVGLLENFVKSELYAKCVELLHDFLCPRVSQRAQLSESRLERLELREVEREEVNFVIFIECAELDPRDHAHAEPLSGSSRSGQPVDGVVIGKGDR